MIWKFQILSSVHANGLEGFLNGTKICPDQLLTQEIESYGVENAVGESSVDRSQENPAFVAWKRQDQLLLSWLMSSISVEILSLVVNFDSSYKLWTNLEENFWIRNYG